MEVQEIINKMSSIEEEIYNYIINTEHWLFYWIANKEVQDFIKEYPEDYDDRVHLQVSNITSSPSFVIKFDSHPSDVGSIERYAVLYTFRDVVRAKWLEWNGKVKERQIEEKEKELAYYKNKVDKIEKEILELKNITMNTEEKVKAYDEALKRAREWHNDSHITIGLKGNLEDIFPELKESEDEKIRKEIIETFKILGDGKIPVDINYADIFTWLEKQGEPTDINPSEFELRLNRLLKQFETLPKEELASSLSFYLNVVQNDGTYVEEKQGEQKPADKVEPKLEIESGKWYMCVRDLLDDYGNRAFCNGDVYLSEKDGYLIPCNSNVPWELTYCVDTYFRNWDITDAKDGDVLVSQYNKPFIYNGNHDSFLIGSYCGISVYSRFIVTTEKCHWTVNENIQPATKEQKEILFMAMKDAGYEFDFEKKELKKIEQKSTNENLTDVDHEYYSDLLSNDDSDNIDDYAYKCAYCMSHDWMKETATWEDIQKAVKLGAEWQKQKSTWSEEDEEILRSIMATCELACEDRDSSPVLKMQLNWLKSLKDRVIPQSKQEWSEEDEDYFDAIITKLEVTQEDAALTDNQLKFLKSLKYKVFPQNHWTPSDEQMEALYEETQKSDRIRDGRIVSLYNDLKKLKGE